LVDKQAYCDIEVIKMPLGDTFFDSIKKMYKKNTIMHICDEVSLKAYLELGQYFDLRKYQLEKSFNKNLDFNKKAKIFKVDSNVEKLTFLEKVEKFKKTCSSERKILIFNLDEISYLTNLRSFQMEYSSNFRAILYLDFDSLNHTLFCDKISKKNKIDGLKILGLDAFSSFVKSVENDIYLNLNNISLKDYLSIQIPKEIKNNNLSLLASIKQTSAIEDIQKAFHKLDCAILNFKKKIKAGLSEYDLNEIFKEEILAQGAKQLSFKTILAIGENTASIHYSQVDKNKILADEQLILLDCGAYFNSGYATDITRTFYFGKNPKPIYKKIYTYVLKAFLNCYLSDITNAKRLDKLARDILNPLEKEGFYFNHGLGHGIGTSVHQNPPILSMNSKDIIKPYQIHSIEPGLYGKSVEGDEFGVRIENCVYSDLNFKKITLSKFPFDELLIDYSLLNEVERNAVKIWQESF